MGSSSIWLLGESALSAAPAGLVHLPSLSKMYYREAYGIDCNVRFDAEVMEIVMCINGYVYSDKLDFPKQTCSYLYNGR